MLASLAHTSSQAPVNRIAPPEVTQVTTKQAIHDVVPSEAPVPFNVAASTFAKSNETSSLPALFSEGVVVTPPPADARPLVVARSDGTQSAAMLPVSVSQQVNGTSAHADPLPLATPAVAEQITRAFVDHATVVARQGSTDFHLRLEPPNLGPVHVYVSATESTVNVRVVAAHEATQALLESQANDLRQSLAHVGVALGGFDVARNGGGSSRSRQQHQETPSLDRRSEQQQVQRSSPPAAVSVLDSINILA